MLGNFLFFKVVSSRNLPGRFSCFSMVQFENFLNFRFSKFYHESDTLVTSIKFLNTVIQRHYSLYLISICPVLTSGKLISSVFASETLVSSILVLGTLVFLLLNLFLDKLCPASNMVSKLSCC